MDYVTESAKRCNILTKSNPKPNRRALVTHGSCLFSPASRRFSILGLLVLFVALNLPISAHADGPHKVLVLNSYHHGFAWTDGIVTGIESVFSSPERVELFVEQMDTKRHFNLRYLNQLRDIYAEKYRAVAFDAIISSDDNALDFLLANRDSLFPGAPIIFCGVNDIEAAWIASHESITGVNEAPDFRGTLEIALQLHPNTRQVAVICDQTTTGKAHVEYLSRITPDFADRVEFEYLTDKTVSELKESLRSLPEGCIVLLLSFFRDREGKTFSYRESTLLVAESCNAPLYTCWDTLMINGFLGGKVISSLAQGKTAAELARRILDGESAESIPIVRESPNVYMFDYQAMSRFGLSMSDLPADSVVLNRPISFYSTYWRELWAATIFMVLQSILILRLLYIGKMRKSAQKSLLNQTEFLHVLIDTVPHPFFYKNRKGKYLGCNTAFAEQIMGIEKERIVGRSTLELPEIVSDGLAKEHASHDEELYRNGTARPYEADVRCADGSRRKFVISKALFRNASGRVGGLVGVMMDLSELRRTEAALRESEQRFRDISENALEWIWEVDADGMYTYANPVVEKILGYKPDEILGRHFFDLFHPDDREELKRRATDVLSNKQCFREFLNRNIHKNGQEVWLSTGGVPVLDENGDLLGYRGADTDITKRKRAEEALRERERFLMAVFDSIQDGLSVLDPELNIIRVNRWHESMYASKMPLVGNKCYFVYQGRDSPCPWCPTLKTLETGESHSAEVPYPSEKNPTAWLDLSTYPLKDSDGQVVGAIEYAKDVTERKRAEESRRKFERQIQQAQKLESLGVLAGGIAHDFNNLLTAILGNANLALSELSPVSPARENLQAIETTSRRAAELCKQMLAYSGKGRFVIGSLNLSEIVEEMTHLLEVSISKKAILKYNFADNLPLIKADPTQIRQIIMNLITNASEAIGNRSGIISISTSVMECDRAYLKGTYLGEELQEGLYVSLEVSDTGCGMDKDTVGRIFDPFFTTKFIGRGLGLAATLGTVRGHNGAIKVRSKKGRGTTFTLLFPVAAEPDEIAARQLSFENEWQGIGTVLLIEDEEAVRITAKLMLERAGFDVLTAADGREGSELFRDRADEIVCVLLDLTMPHKGGEETFRELRLVREDVPVILMSGYSELEVTERFAGMGLSGFIQKPYQYSELAAQLRKVLEGN